MKLALLQLLPRHKDAAFNLKKGLDACDKASMKGADIAIFPEMWNIGYDFDWTPDEAIAQDSDFIKAFQDKARTLKMAIVITYLENRTGQIYNSLSFIDRDGVIRVTYSKVHTCAFSYHEAPMVRGQKFETVDFEGVRLGFMICFDREFPESARTLIKKGAEVIIVPNACGLHDDEYGQMRRKQIEVRAYENMCVMGVVNYPAPQEDGHSIVVGPFGVPLHTSTRDEKVMIVDVDIDALRRYQREEVWGLKYANPAAYE